jgi:DNA-binding NarL/FixJ family response regulator
VIELPPPAELAFLTDAIGAEATLALIEARAGTRVYVPTRIDARAPLAKMIGSKAAAALAAAHGGCYIVPPSAKRWRAQIYTMRGQSAAEVALRLGLDESTVRRYRATSLGTRKSSGQAPRRRTDLKPATQMDLPI